jgi:hypothetical protein
MLVLTRPSSLRKNSGDYSHWDAWPEDDNNVSQNRRPHSSSEGDIVDHKTWMSEPRRWTVRGSSNQEGIEKRMSLERANRRRSNSGDVAFQLSNKATQIRHEQKKLLASFNNATTKTNLAPFNPEGGKLRDCAPYFFSAAYGLGGHNIRSHDDVIREAQALTNCSMCAIQDLLYGYSYADVLAHLRTQVQAYPAKVCNKTRDLQRNRSILLGYVAGHFDAQRRTAQHAHTAPNSPLWKRAKQITNILPEPVLLSPFIF